MLLWQGYVCALPDIPSLSDCPDRIHHSGFQNHSAPTMGIGGAYPGPQTETIVVNQVERTYYTYIPSNYDPQKAWPLIMVLHGAAPPGQTQQYALDMRNYWQQAAESYQMILVAPVASGSQSWIPGIDSPIWVAILEQMESSYNIETNRYYGWGFSAGGHVGHWFFLLNSEYFAAYAVNAGVLSAYAEDLGAPGNAVRQLPVFESVGDVDPLYNEILYDRQLFLDAGWVENQNYVKHVFAGGHILPASARTKAANFLCERTLLD